MIHSKDLHDDGSVILIPLGIRFISNVTPHKVESIGHYRRFQRGFVFLFLFFSLYFSPY